MKIHKKTASTKSIFTALLLIALSSYITLFTFMVVPFTNQALRLTHAINPFSDLNDGYITGETIKNNLLYKGICDFGNWLSDRRDPLISDEKMIEHWRLHHEEWEAAERTIPYDQEERKRNFDYEAFVRRTKSAGLDVYYDTKITKNKQHYDALIPSKSLGQHRAIRPCTRIVSKVYIYYPDILPVVHGGKLVKKDRLDFAIAKGIKPYGYLLVESTNIPHYEPSLRKLNERWYIASPYTQEQWHIKQR